MSISPLKDDSPTDLHSTWVPMRPFGDVAMMLGMSYLLIAENLYDQAFIRRYTIGFDKVRRTCSAKGMVSRRRLSGQKNDAESQHKVLPPSRGRPPARRRL